MGKPSTDKAGVRQTYRALKAAGYGIDVQDGAGEEFLDLNENDAIGEVMSCDDGYFLVKDSSGERFGWVWFVFGNDPEEVICDHTTNLSHVLDPMTEMWWNSDE